MPLYQAIILAVVQGLTEFSPVSSTAHLAIVPRLFHFADPGLGFDVALHVGTLVAILIFFFRDWVQVIANGLGFSYRGVVPDENSRSLLWFLVVGTIPVLIAGAALKNYAEGPWRTLFVMGTTLIVLGIVMYFGDRVGQNKRRLNKMSWTDAIAIEVLLSTTRNCGRCGEGYPRSSKRRRRAPEVELIFGIIVIALGIYFRNGG